jgi:hypothetical protein
MDYRGLGLRNGRMAVAAAALAGTLLIPSSPILAAELCSDDTAAACSDTSELAKDLMRRRVTELSRRATSSMS